MRRVHRRRRPGTPIRPRRQRRACAAPPRTVPGRLRATCCGRSPHRLVIRSAAASPTSPTRRWPRCWPRRLPAAPGLRFAIIGMGRLGGREMSYSSDADVLFVYEPPAGVAEDTASGVAHAVAEQIRARADRAGAGPAARRRRRPAARGPAGSAGPQPRRLPAVLRALVEGLGGAGAAACPVRRRRRRSRRAVPRARRRACATRPAASRPSRSSRSAGSRPGSTPSGCPAAPTRPRTPSSAAAGSPTSSGRCSCCSSGTVTRSPGCGRRVPSTLLTPHAPRA